MFWATYPVLGFLRQDLHIFFLAGLKCSNFMPLPPWDYMYWDYMMCIAMPDKRCFCFKPWLIEGEEAWWERRECLSLSKTWGRAPLWLLVLEQRIWDALGSVKCLPHSAFYRAISRCAAGAREGCEMGYFISVAWSLLARVYIKLWNS